MNDSILHKYGFVIVGSIIGILGIVFYFVDTVQNKQKVENEINQSMESDSIKELDEDSILYSE